jgi:hypothetical protein
VYKRIEKIQFLLPPKTVALKNKVAPWQIRELKTKKKGWGENTYALKNISKFNPAYRKKIIESLFYLKK